METFAHLLPSLLLAIVTGIPLWILLGRVGLSRWWTLLAILPLGFLILLWMLALRRWPRLPGQERGLQPQ